jgi:hypothetical protein
MLIREKKRGTQTKYFLDVAALCLVLEQRVVDICMYVCMCVCVCLNLLDVAALCLVLEQQVVDICMHVCMYVCVCVFAPS